MHPYTRSGALGFQVDFFFPYPLPAPSTQWSQVCARARLQEELPPTPALPATTALHACVRMLPQRDGLPLLDVEEADSIELAGDTGGAGDVGVPRIVGGEGHEGGVMRSIDPVAQWTDTLYLAVVDLVAGGRRTQPLLTDILEVCMEEVLLAGHRPL